MVKTKQMKQGLELRLLGIWLKLSDEDRKKKEKPENNIIAYRKSPRRS